MAEIVIFGNYTREGFRLETNEPLAQQMLGDDWLVRFLVVELTYV
jgi:hypothetical protein